MDIRPLVLAFLLLAIACAPARAHDGGVTHRDTIQEVNFDFAAAVENGDDGMASGYGDAGLTYLPLRWCGTRRTTDDTANQVYAGALPQVKLVYAHASDEPDRFAEWADALQANASLISRFYAQQSGGQKAPRFDLGTSCGADYVDIATVRLPNPRSFYVGSLDRVQEAVDAALPRTAGGARDYVILGDKLSNGGLNGLGWMWYTDAKGTGNEHNRGGVTSVIFVPQEHSPPTTDAAKDQGYWPEGFLHEMNHNFGAVQGGSPNSTQAGHCRDGLDVMCYADGGLSYDSGVCPAITSFTAAFAQMLDCGRDDYFSPDPVAGSWLATHFNTFDSVFVGDCPALGNQCGGGVAPGVTGGPTVTGDPRTGQTLTADPGTWSGNPALTLQWEEESGGVWQPYANDAATLVLGTANAGRRYRVKVTAAGAETVVARSHPTAEIATQDRPAMEVRPSISGIAGTGGTLTGNPGVWTQASTFAFQWYRMDSENQYAPVDGATGPTYAVTASDTGYRMLLLVRARSSSNLDTYEWSHTTRTVVTLPTNTAAPAVSGTAKQDRTLSSTAGTWTSATSYAHEWQREVDGTWTDIAGATGTDYTLSAEDVGRRVRVLVRAINADGSRTATSEPSDTVAPLAPPVNTAPPVVTGDALEGATLTAEGDTWAGAVTTAVGWERRAAGGDWTPIDGAAGRSHVLTAADVDAEVRAVVTATNEDGSATAASAPRGPVAALPPEATAPPAITGEPRTGQPLTASTGTWLRATTYAYAWQREDAGSWTPIHGADQSTYTPAAADAGLRLRVVVTATGPGGATADASAPTQPVADPPVLQAAPAISGTVKRGSALTATTGTWENATAYAYAWERQDGTSWTPIELADEATYVPGAADVGHALRVVVTATNPNGSASAPSDATAAVADAAVPANVTPPVVAGTLYVGDQLTVAEHEWTGADSFEFQWQRRAPGGDWIAVAATESYVLEPQDAGAEVRVRVTAINAEGRTTVDSAARGPVDADPANVAPPTVTGTAEVGQTLEATAGTWLRATTYAYAWQRRAGDTWSAIDGADESTYTPVAGDSGHPLRVVVTATGSRASASAASAETQPVADPPPPAAVAAPVVTGDLYAGETLTVTGDDWTGETGTTVAWQRRTGEGAWTPIAGAAGRSYGLTGDDLGAFVRAVVTASNPYGSATQESDGRGPVGADPVNTQLPAISGTPRVGELLVATPGTWSHATSFSYAWQRQDGGVWTDVTGATGDRFTPTSTDAGLPLRVLVTGHGSRRDVTVASAQTAPVAAAPADEPPADEPPVVTPPNPPPAAQPPASVEPQPQPPAAPRTASFSVSLRAGRRSAGKLVVTVTGTSATVKGSRLKLRAGTYKARFCASRRCVTRKLKVRRGRIAASRVTLPAATGQIALTLKPRRGAAAKGKLVLLAR